MNAAVTLGIPENIVGACASLLQPYGVDFPELLSKANKNFGRVEKKYLTATQAANYSGLAPKTIRDKALARCFKSKRLGHSSKSRVLIEKESFDAWLESFDHDNQ